VSNRCFRLALVQEERELSGRLSNRAGAAETRNDTNRRRFRSQVLKGVVSVAPVFLSGCSEAGAGFLTPGGPIASFQLHQLWQVTLIVLIVVVPVLVGVPLLAWRYRYSNTKAQYAPHWDFSTALEYPMWLIPAAIVVVLSVLVWIDAHKLDPYRPIASSKPPLEVQVVGLDWKWLFIYPEYHIATVGEMAFPQDRPVSMRLTTDTVMQAFMIPELGGQIYAMPGMVTQLNLKADKDGSFEGMNTQYNGDGFHAQHFQAVAMKSQDFDRWVEAVQAKGAALNQTGYRLLAKSSTPAEVRSQLGTAAMPKDVTFFNDVAPDIFQTIVERYHGGKELPSDEQPGTAAYNARLARQ
jgi:cytochrome o ubiquinol oxidase subunit 2